MRSKMSPQFRNAGVKFDFKKDFENLKTSFKSILPMVQGFLQQSELDRIKRQREGIKLPPPRGGRGSNYAK